MADRQIASVRVPSSVEKSSFLQQYVTSAAERGEEAPCSLMYIHFLFFKKFLRLSGTYRSKRALYNNFSLHTIPHRSFFLMQSHKSHSSSCWNKVICWLLEENWIGSSYFKSDAHSKHCSERHWCLWCNLVTWKGLHRSPSRYMKCQHGGKKGVCHRIKQDFFLISLFFNFLFF